MMVSDDSISYFCSSNIRWIGRADARRVDVQKDHQGSRGKCGCQTDRRISGVIEIIFCSTGLFMHILANPGQGQADTHTELHTFTSSCVVMFFIVGRHGSLPLPRIFLWPLLGGGGIPTRSIKIPTIMQ